MQDVFAKQFADLPGITGLPFRRSGGRWIAACYMSGKKHHQKDKTYAILKDKGVYIIENGGDDISLPEFLDTYGDISKLGDFDQDKEVVKVKQVERIFVDPIHVESTVPAQYSGNLFTFLSSLFGSEKVQGVFHRYNVGIDGDDVIYWYMNELGAVCHDARITYGVDGKRVKDRGGWRRHKVDMGYNAKCVFGAHLLPLYEDAEVCVVESEKACLIMALVETKGRLWVATGGGTKINLIRDGWLKFGDYDDIGRSWNGIHWWDNQPAEDGDGIDDLVLKIIKNRR